MVDSTLQVIVRDRERILLSKPAQWVEAYNAKGSFTVLPYHTNYISVIEKKIIVGTAVGIEEDFEFGVGIMKVVENTVEVFLEERSAA